MSSAEIADCEAQAKLTEAKVAMERQNTLSVGDINAYAFLKSSTPNTTTPVAGSSEPVKE